MKAVVATVIALALLYMADQEFADGRYTQETSKVARHIRYSMGF